MRSHAAQRSSVSMRELRENLFARRAHADDTSAFPYLLLRLRRPPVRRQSRGTRFDSIAMDERQTEDWAAHKISADARTTILPGKQELIGQKLNNRYLIEKQISSGGMGVIYLARDEQLHARPVVVKVLLEEAYQCEYVVQKFQQEVEALSRIDHPGIVGIIDAGELPGGKPFIVMQYVAGVTLRSVMKPEGMEIERTANIVKQIGRALGAAHDRGIFHRDLKPDNIMLQNLGQGEEQVKIIDFGIAKIKNSVIAPSTATNISAGTVAYMAPEQLNARPVSAATDIYALGLVVFEVVTGRRPFNPETGFELLEMQRVGVRVNPIDLRPSLPQDAQQVILKALSFEPKDRYQKARDFGDALAWALMNDDETRQPPSQQSVEIPPTRLSTDQAPRAASSAALSQKTIPALFESAHPVNPATAQLGLARDSDAALASKRKPRSILGILAAVVIAFTVFAVWYVARSRNGSSGRKDVGALSGSGERLLNYGLTVQKMRDGRPYQEPFESSGQEIFENGWTFRMNISSAQQGYLYLINEGPAAGGSTTYNLLFPEAETNGGSPLIAANQSMQSAWMRFDDHQGTEKLWLVWSASPIKELEAVKATVNERERGAISDSSQARAIHNFLAQNSSPKPVVEKDSVKKQTIVKGSGDPLVSFIELEHH
jgi:serine/threonine protein kinase